MKTAPLISVIVPVYKVEAYLEECVESILSQTYANLEVILVDDGSPDNCPALCDAFAQRDPRVRVIHKENGGLSSARNAGLDICRGEYIGFVDSDDWIEPEMYEMMLEACVRQAAPMAACNLYHVNGSSGERYWQGGEEKEELLSAQETLGRILIWDRIEVSCCSKLYRRELWDGIRMPEGEIGEDTAVMCQVLFQAGTVVFCDRPLYNYRQRPGSITAAEFAARDFVLIKHAEEILSFVQRSWPDIEEQARYFHLMEVGYVLCRLSVQSREVRAAYQAEYDACLRTLRKNRGQWMTSRFFSDKDRVRFALLSSGLYRVWDRFRRKRSG